MYVKILVYHITAVWFPYLKFSLFPASTPLLSSPCTSFILELLSPLPTSSAAPFVQFPTLKVQFAFRALQKDGTHRVQIVIAVTAQRPSACLCDLEWTISEKSIR